MQSAYSTDELPTDMIEAKHAARIAMIHVSGIHRWILKGKLRGWKRAGRVFVSRAELNQLFVPIAMRAPAKERFKDLPPSRRDRERQLAWADKVLREAGIRG